MPLRHWRCYPGIQRLGGLRSLVEPALDHVATKSAEPVSLYGRLHSLRDGLRTGTPSPRRVRHAAMQAIYDVYLTDGWQRAMQMFMTHIGVVADGDASQWEPTPEQLARMQGPNKVFFGHLLRQTTAFRPDVAALKAAQTRIVVGVGATSTGQLAHRTGLALAETLGVAPVVFPGDHGGFISQPGEFAQTLQEILG